LAYDEAPEILKTSPFLATEHPALMQTRLNQVRGAEGLEEFDLDELTSASASCYVYQD